MQPMMAGEYAGGPDIPETESTMTSPTVPEADISRPEVGPIGDLTTGIDNWAGPYSEPL